MPLRVSLSRITLIALLLLMGAGCLAAQASSASPATPDKTTAASAPASTDQGQTSATPPATATPGNTTVSATPASTNQGQATSGKTPAAKAPANADERARIVRGVESVEADHFSGDMQAQALDLKGHVQITLPEGSYTADSAHYNLSTMLGQLENAKGLFVGKNALVTYHFFAKQLLLEAKNVRHLKDARLTTCDQEIHPHYQLLVRDFVWYPNNTYTARHITFEWAGHRIITLPVFSGQIPTGNTTSSKPFFSAGIDKIDGGYVMLHHDIPFGEHNDLDLSGRFGTEDLLRGGATLNRQIPLPQPFTGGLISLIATSREDVLNQLLVTKNAPQALQTLTVSRLPALQASLNPFPLPGLLHRFSVSMGAGYGLYHEEPTGVTSPRTQAWGILHAPTYHLGPFQLYGECGLRDAYYPGSAYQTTLAEVGMKTPETSKLYFNLAYIHRDGVGYTPFLFDRVEVPSELFGAIEVPIMKNGLWRAGFWQSEDMATGTMDDYGITGIYQEDCIGYGLSYDRVSHGVSFNIVMTGFGTFHRANPSVGFTQ